MKARHVPFAAAVFAVACASARAADTPKFTPARDGNEVVLFDAASSDFSIIRNYTTSWRKGSNLTPVAKPVEKNGQRFVEFTYRGTSGSACSTFWYQNVPKPDENARYTGIRFTIDYDKDDFAKVSAHGKFTDGTGVTLVLTLEPGCKDYPFAGGFRRAKTPIKWELLSYFWLSASATGPEGNPLKFRLKRAVMEQKKSTLPTRSIEITRVRKVHEILPVVRPPVIDGALRDAAWRGCPELARFCRRSGGEVAAEDSPYRVRVAYDDDRIYIATRSEFPTRPVAKETRRDGSVYGDEAQEFFFSGPNDNDQKVQFVVNVDGAIFDCAKEYDLVAAEVKTKIDKSIAHEKAMRYRAGSWTTEIAFPLSELRVDLGKQRHMGFQVAQSYIQRSDPKLGTVTWSPARRFPDPRTFGVLVFNRHAFGPGTVTVGGGKRLDKKDGLADFSFDCTFADFETGAYWLKWELLGASVDPVEEMIELGAGRETNKTLKVAGAANTSGTYTLTVTLLNAREDARVCVVNFENSTDAPDLFGERLLSPRVKQIEWKKGAFPARMHTDLYLERDATARTRRTAELFRQDYLEHTGVNLNERPAGWSLPSSGVVLRLARSARFKGQRAEPHEEGYHLSVEKDRVVITGFDEPGLYYGTVTLFLLMRNSMRIEDAMPVPCVEILDWPDLHYRMVSSQGQGAFRNQTPKDAFGIEWMMEWVDRFVAGHKANVLYWDLSSRVKYERRPEFNGSEKMYSLDDLRRFGDYCRDRFVEVCPAWQVGGHANWWLLGYHPELREKGYKIQGDVTHPKHNEVVFDCMLDVIEALKCKYASPKSDEWWGGRKAGETADDLLRGMTRAEAFLDFHVKLNDWLKARGVTMLVYHDMLTPYHNGKKFDLYKIVDRFPKDAIIQYWGGHDKEKGIAFFVDHGFKKIWIHSTGSFIWLNDKSKPHVSGAGKILYSLGNDKVGNLLDQYSDFNNMYASFRILDYAWNLYDYKPPEEGRLVTIKNIMAVRPNPSAAAKVEPLDIGAQLTDSFNAKLKEFKPKEYGNVETPVVLEPGTRELGFIPMRLLPDTGEGNCLVMREGGEPVSIPVDARYSSLVFLHTAFINNPKDRRARGGMGRFWIYGWPCGDYIVHYEDGEKLKLPLRLSMNIRRFDTSSKNRATNDNRYVLAVKDANQENVHLFQWEWVNPRPEQRITKVEVRHDNQLDVSLILFAVSGRSVWGK